MNTGNAKNRGYFKIKGASSAFNFDFRDKVVLDIGSSTGGFTEYALEKGAKKVIAVEKGTNQMKSSLRDDPRVELHEKTDIFEVKAKDSSSESVRSRAPQSVSQEGIFVAPFPDIILADVSFTSLTKIIKYAKMNLSRSNTNYLVMLKPQFEATPKDLNNGVVKNETIRRQIIKNFESWLKSNGFIIIKKHDNELEGRHGNKERFYWLKNASA